MSQLLDALAAGAPARAGHWRSRRAIVLAAPLAVFLFSLMLYVRTAARTITWAHGGADGAELSAAAAVLGVAHPTGYPLFLLLGHLFAQLPVGEVAFRVGLLSAVAAALGASLAACLAATLLRPDTDRTATIAGHSTLAALATGLGLAASPLYWSQATIAEVYALHAALILAALLLLAGWRPGEDRRAAAIALLLGIGMGNHVTLAFLASLAGLYVLAQDHRIVLRRGGALVVAAFLAGLLIYLYLPLRAAADPPINWGETADWPHFLAHVTGNSYQGYVGSQGAEKDLARVPAQARLLGGQLTWPGLVLATIGLGELMRRRRAMGRLLLAYCLVTIGFSLIYNAKDAEVYLLPVVIVLAVGFGLGVAEMASLGTSPRLRIALGVGAIALCVRLISFQVGEYFPEMDLSTDRTAVDYARSTLATQQPRAILLTENDEQTFALWYGQVVEGLRPDVVVIDRRGQYLEWYRTQLDRRYPGVARQVWP